VRNMLRWPRRSPYRRLGQRGGKNRRGNAPQRRMRATMVVLHSLPRAQHLRLRKPAKQFRLQQLIPQPSLKALGVAVLPRTAGLDVQRLHLGTAEPHADRPRDELGAVVRADVPWRAADGKQFPQEIQRGRECSISTL
jgi:hypothetical protein